MTKKKDQANYDHFAQFGNDVEGYEGLNMDTMAIPFIRVLQAMSPQLNKKKAEYIAAAEQGNICNSITGMLYDAPLRMVIGKFERLMIEWKPNRGGFVQAHAPEVVETNPDRYRLLDIQGRLTMVDMETKNHIVDTYMYYVILPDYMQEGVCVLSLSSSQLKQAKKLNRQLLTTYLPGTTQKALPHFMVWTMDVTEESNDKGDWYGLNFAFDTFVDQAQLDYVMEQRAELPNRSVDLNLLEDKGTNTTPDTDNVQY